MSSSSSSNTTTSKRQITKEGTNKQSPPTKKTCIRSTLEPNITCTITVGGVDFHENSNILCSWSNYFDRALKSGMKESETRKFDFPDRDPREWEWIVSLMAPTSKEKITESNLSTALDWFDFLASDCGLERCDKVFYRKVLRKNQRGFKLRRKDLSTILENLGTALQYRLKFSTSNCLDFISQAFRFYPTFFDMELLTKIVALVKENEECRSALWDSLKSCLPSSMSDDEAKNLLENDTLHETLHVAVARIQAEYLLSLDPDYCPVDFEAITEQLLRGW